MKRKLCFVALAAMTLAALAPAAAAGNTTDVDVPSALRPYRTTAFGAEEGVLNVQIGAGLGRRIPGFTARAMVPIEDGDPTVRVHSGDVIHLIGGAVFLPQGQTAETWRDAVASDPADPYFPFYEDPDADLPGVKAPTYLNPRLFGPSDFSGCGASADNPCEFDGTNSDPLTGALNSGDAGEFYVRINAQPNSEIWAVQPIDWPAASNFKIEVVPNGEAASTQEEIDEARKSLRTEDRETALLTLEGLQDVTKYREDGKLVYEVYAGYDVGPIAFFAYFPQNLTIKKGATVRFRFDALGVEPHTATMPFKQGVKTVRTSFQPACDPDGTGPGPDEPANFGPEGPPCPEPEQFELDLTRRFTAEVGDNAFPGRKKRRYENSGIRGAWAPEGLRGFAGGSDPWDVKFTKRSGRDAYRYLCALHGRFMSGSIRVR